MKIFNIFIVVVITWLCDHMHLSNLKELNTKKDEF